MIIKAFERYLLELLNVKVMEGVREGGRRKGMTLENKYNKWDMECDMLKLSLCLTN
jgi:hypothetical protein